MTTSIRSGVEKLLAAFVTLCIMATAAACGDDDSAGGVPPPAEELGSGSSEESAVTSVGHCSTTSATGSSPANDSFSATGGVGVSLEDGKAYTIYLTDFDVSLEDVSFVRAPSVPDGGTMFTVAVTVFNAPDVDSLEPVAVGQTIDYTSEWEVLTFTVMATDAAGTHGTATDAGGTIEVTGIGGAFCGTIVYADGEKSLSGSFEIPVKAV